MHNLCERNCKVNFHFHKFKKKNKFNKFNFNKRDFNYTIKELERAYNNCKVSEDVDCLQNIAQLIILFTNLGLDITDGVLNCVNLAIIPCIEDFLNIIPTTESIILEILKSIEICSKIPGISEKLKRK